MCVLNFSELSRIKRKNSYFRKKGARAKYKLHPDFRDIIQKKWSDDFDYDKPIIQCWVDVNGQERWFEELATPVYENGELNMVFSETSMVGFGSRKIWSI